MRGRPSPLKEEAVRLRVEERLSLREISERIGAPKGSLSGWLKAYPLTTEEQRAKLAAKAHPRGPRKPRGEESKHHQAIAGKTLTKQNRARIAEAAVLFRLALHGFVVLRSEFDGDKADWAVESESGKICKIQVKNAHAGRWGQPMIQLRCNSAGRGTQKRTYRCYQKGEIDFMVGYDLYTDTAYVFSFEEIADHKGVIAVRPDAAERWDKLV